jgi:hypothetical protein
MSPELFYSLYSAENGFADTDVLIADLHDESNWYAVDKPMAGKRIEVGSRSPLYLLVRTIKRSKKTRQSVQQSDYAFAWQHGAKTAQPPSALQDLGRRIGRSFRLRRIRVERNESLRKLRVHSVVDSRRNLHTAKHRDNDAES